MTRGVIALGLIAAVVILIVCLGRQDKNAPAPDKANGTPPPAVKTADGSSSGLVVEGLSEPELMLGEAQLVRLEPPMQKLTDATAVAGWCLCVPEGPNHHELNPADKEVDGKRVPNGTALFKVNVETPGEYNLWAHKWWCCSCGDSFRYALDDGPLLDFISDSNYQVWEWAHTRNGRVRLTKGVHTLVIANREDGFRVDRFLLRMGDATPAPLTSP